MNPCGCWVSRAVLHEGHCCFRALGLHTDDVCHDVEGFAWRVSLGQSGRPDEDAS